MEQQIVKAGFRLAHQLTSMWGATAEEDTTTAEEETTFLQ